VLLAVAPLVGGRRLPLGPDGARPLVEEVAVAGLRGQAAWEVAPLATAVEAVAELWHRTGSWLATADLNPLILTPDGPIAVDALLIAAHK
jgi:acetate---CoA ligase (ADP-forming)